ncbi:MAG: exo-alpha-sialidase [Bryobacterales bacterium]|nr:exo-alpha-sialidase [Bryobacterales bacterium]
MLALLALHIVPESPQMEFRQPQLATDGKRVGVAFGAGQTVFFASSVDQGRTFAKPVAVSQTGKLSLGRHRGPRLAFTPDAVVISAIVGEKGGGADGDLLSWRSTDGGQTWSSAVPINDVPGAAREGLHAMASGGGVLFATWLDLRSNGTKLYGAASRDGGRTWSKNVLVYESPSGTICQCCHPSVAIDSRGRIAVMFRNAVEGARDMYVTESADGASFSPARKLGEGTWMLNACPMDGGGLALDPHGKPATTWRREKQVYLAGATGAEQLLGEGKDSALAVGKKGVYVAWTSPDGVVVLAPGSASPSLLSAEKGAGFPQLLPLSDGKILAAWESKGRLEFQLVP